MTSLQSLFCPKRAALDEDGYLQPPSSVRSTQELKLSFALSRNLMLFHNNE